MSIAIPDWVVYHDDDWTERSPAEAGLDPAAFAAFIAGMDVRGAAFGGEDHSGAQYGAVIARWSATPSPTG